MFADDTKCFYSSKKIKHVFNIFNKELKIIQAWFNADKLSLNTKRQSMDSFIL